MENNLLSARAPLRQHSNKWIYSIDFFKSFSSTKVRQLSSSLWRNLTQLGISRVKPTRRGCRGGKRRSQLHPSAEIINQSDQHIDVTSIELSRQRYLHRESIPKTRNYNNLLSVSRFIPDRYKPSNMRFALWNARSIKNKTASLCDYILTRQLDVMALTETWLNGDDRDSHTLADISRTLGHYNITHIPRKKQTWRRYSFNF